MRKPLLASALAAALALHARARAQGRDPAAGSHVEGFVRMRQAAVARQRGDLDEAVRLLREAVALGAPPLALRDLAQTLESQQRWREAAGAWTRYGALGPSEPERRAALERREGLRRMLTALRVRVTPPFAARASRVWFDHEPPRWYAAGGVEQVAEGGTHRVRVEAQGFEPWEMMVPTGFGDPVQVTAVMVRIRTTGDAGAP